jgi:hypothetical protein
MDFVELLRRENRGTLPLFLTRITMGGGMMGYEEIKQAAEQGDAVLSGDTILIS